MKEKKAIIIGAGPAGLTAAYELLKKTDIKPIIYEMDSQVGGISKTVDYKGNRIDIGGHRFFTKSREIKEWWLNILPLQGKPAKDDILLDREAPFSKENNAPDPEKTDRVMLTRKRVSSILTSGKFIDYPLSLGLRTLGVLGFYRILKIAASYTRARVFPIRPEKTLEDFFINRFGKEIYSLIFEDYTRKVWGVSCGQIDRDWGIQRVKGLSAGRVVLYALKSAFFLKGYYSENNNTEASLIERFLYPKLGPGQFWEEVARIIEEKGGQIHLGHRVTLLNMEDSKIRTAEIRDERNGSTFTVEGDYFFSSMPVKDLIAALGKEVPAAVKEVAGNLLYRDFITVGVLAGKLKIKNQRKIKTPDNIIPDNWIYVQDKRVKLGRIQIFNNWSPYMVKDEHTVWLGLDYFCNEADAIWKSSDREIKDLAVAELLQIGFIEKADVLDSVVIRVKKAYPAYYAGYAQFQVVRDFTDTLENLFLIGRNGMHRYNNTDHSMLTAMTAVENIVCDRISKDNIWRVNVEREYHE
ncbi:MAG: NAD(P)/FAD-dependent oxidoreductase [Candidatus Omnitrophota bacterium]